MKLISKTILYYLLISLPLLIIAGLLSYHLIRTEVRDGTDETLLREKNNAENLIKVNPKNQILFLSTDSISNISPIKIKKDGFSFSDSLIYDPTEKEDVNYRFLRSFYTSNNQSYLITIAKPTFEEDELIEGLLSAFALIFGFLVIGFFVVNWVLSKTLWKPFYKTLTELNSYDIRKHESHSFEPATTVEFNQLNRALNKMTEKIHSDFLQQKEFTENASHEMQTPLAVVKATVSLMMQSPNLKEEEMNQLQTIENTLRKLSALNKTLILLTKIENNQFQKNETVNLKETIAKTLNNYADLIDSRNIKLETDLSADLKIEINPVLADVLISNLIQNAIRHNIEGGKIGVSIKGKTVIVSNSGEPLTINKEDLYVRFKKNDSSKDSLGLGLSIVKSIVDNHGYSISYHYNDLLHTFSIQFI